METTLIKIWFNRESAITGKDPWKIQIDGEKHFVSQVNFSCRVATKSKKDLSGNFQSWLEVNSSDFHFKDSTLTIK